MNKVLPVSSPKAMKKADKEETQLMLNSFTDSFIE